MPERLRRVAIVIAAAAATGAMLAAVPSIGLQFAILVAGAAIVATALMMRLDRVLNPAIVIVAALYLVGPVGTLLGAAGIGVSTVGLVMLAPVPFVAAALVLRPGAHQRLAYLAPLILLAAVGAVSLAWSPNASYGLEKLTLWTLTGILPAAFILVLASATPRVMWGAVALAAVVSAVGLIGFGETSALYPGRVALFGDNPIWTARAAFVGALVMTFGPFPRIVRVIVTPILIVAGILTVSLGPLLGFAIGVWAGIAETLRTSVRTADRRQLGWIALGFASGIGVIALLGNSLFGGESSILASVVVNDPNVTGRATFLDAALRLFLSSPLLGVGLGGFESTGLIQYPHNLVAEIGSELGLVGLLALAAWFVLALRGAAGSPILVALLIATAVFGLFSGSVASNAEFWLVSALAVAKIPVRARARAPAPENDPEPAPAAAPAVAISR
jgi:O-antigen ligase